MENNEEKEDKFEVLEKNRYESTRDYAIRVLEHNIINLNLEPGTLLSEATVSSKLDLSRTPVREAFFDLSRFNLVSIIPQRGTRVAYIDVDIVEDARFARLAIERSVVELVAANHQLHDIVELRQNIDSQKQCALNKDYNRMFQFDNEFHKLLFHICKKDTTFEYFARLRSHFDRVRMLNVMQLNFDRIVTDHVALVDAIEASDSVKAVALITEHLSRINTDIIALKEEYPQFFVTAKTKKY